MRRLLPLAIVLVFAAGCSVNKPGEKTVAPLPVTVVGTVPTVQQASVPAEYKNGDATAGKQVFLTAGCTGCHTLKAAGSTGTIGPNLDDAKPNLARIFDRLTHGKGAMPSFAALGSTKIANVAAFVYASTHGG